MNSKAKWITRTAAMLALLIALQWITKPLGQLVTGSCVNAILAITVRSCGMGSGVTVALLSPLFAFGLGIAPNVVAVPVIMMGNTAYVAILRVLSGKGMIRNAGAVVAAALAKFGIMYLLIGQVVCGLLADALLSSGFLKEPMLRALPATFSWPQLVTALIGGLISLAVIPILAERVSHNGWQKGMR